jgi:hypothetical protein
LTSPALPKIAPTIVARKARATRSPRKATGRPPLLVIDGDSFVHRAYHALPKSIRGKGDRPAGAILGFANLLLRLYREEKPRAVLVGWDTYEEPTYRPEAFACGLLTPSALGTRPTISLPRRLPPKSGAEVQP